MTITIRADKKSEIQKVLQLLSNLDLESVEIGSDDVTIERGNKKIDPKALFGIWKKEPKTIDNIRAKAWTSL